MRERETGKTGEERGGERLEREGEMARKPGYRRDG